MRISDWSSDVCSSDLLGPAAAGEDVQELFVPGVKVIAKGLFPWRHPADGELLAGEAGSLAEGADLELGIGVEGGADVEQIGRESWRERVCQYVEISVVAGSLKKKTKTRTEQRK